MTGWVLGTVVPNTVLLPWFDSFGANTNYFYKDIKFDKRCMLVLNEVQFTYTCLYQT